MAKNSFFLHKKLRQIIWAAPTSPKLLGVVNIAIFVKFGAEKENSGVLKFGPTTLTSLFLGSIGVSLEKSSYGVFLGF